MVVPPFNRILFVFKVESRLYGLRSAVKSFGIERFKNNCARATDGFDYVLKHLHEKQQYLTELRQRKSQEIKARGENAIKQAALRATAQKDKAIDFAHMTKGRYKLQWSAMAQASRVNLMAQTTDSIPNRCTATVVTEKSGNY